MASNPITSWQIEGENVEVVTDFIFWGSTVTADVDCSHKTRRQLFLGRKAMTNLDRILKSKDITLLTKVHIVKAMVFPKSWLFASGGQSTGASASASISPSNECSGLTSFRIDCFDLLAV